MKVRQFRRGGRRAGRRRLLHEADQGPRRLPERVIETFRAMRQEVAPRQGESRKTWVQAVRIGDVAIVGVPGEFFTVLGQEIKRRSPFRYTYVFELANDYIGYIPDQAGLRPRRLPDLDRPAQLPRAGDRRADRRRGRRAARAIASGASGRTRVRDRDEASMSRSQSSPAESR